MPIVDNVESYRQWLLLRARHGLGRDGRMFGWSYCRRSRDLDIHKQKKTLKMNNLDFFELWVKTGLDSVEKISKFIESVATFHFVVGLHFL